MGAPSATAAGGRVWLFKRSGSKYSIAPTEITAHEAATGRLGASVALSQTGATALFGAPATNLRVGAALSLLGIPVAPPTVRSVAPNSGPSSGGTSVTLEGSGFLPGATVTIGGEATSVEVLSESKLTARTPAHAPGSDEVVVSDEYGTSSHGPSFTYFPQPIVTSVTPASGPTSGGTTITIEGSGFVAGVTTVTIGGVAASVTVISPSKLIATTAAAPAGSYEVVVSNGGTNSSGGPSFTYEPANFGLTSLITSGGSTQVLGNTTSQTPQPVLGVSGDISPVSGKVYVRLPGSKKFVLLTGLLNVPFGTIVDAREGTVAVTTQGKKGLQTVNLYEGAFVLSQGSNGVVTATLYGGNFGVCPTKRERAHKAASASARRRSRSHVVRKLWANGHGTYTTKGNYATGAVLGTVWETIDRCSGTGIHVVTDSVLVTNLVTHKKVRVKAGHTYIAKAP